MQSRTLPKFRLPPVTETVLGVEFAPLVGWRVPHFGLFWNRIRDRFPKYEIKPPLDTQIEQFNGPARPVSPAIQVLLEPEVRCWFIDASDRALIQVQNNRFTYNWRKTGPDDAYPHYDETIRPAFERIWNEYQAFVAAEQIGELNIVQCEVTYVNHLEIGKGWRSPAEISNIFPFLSNSIGRGFLPMPERLGFNITFRLPDKQGRLRISMSPAVRHTDGSEVLQLNLTARGKPVSSDTASVLGWLDTGREWVVRGFADVTSDAMHAIWEKAN